MIDLNTGPMINIALISFLLLFNLIYTHKDFDLVFLFVNIHTWSLVFYLFFQSVLLNPMSYEIFFLILSYTSGFVIGYYLHYCKNKGSNIIREEVNYKNLYRYNLIGFFIFLLAFLYELSYASWVLPILAENKLYAYYTFPTRFVHYLVVVGIAISGTFTYIAERYRYKRKTVYLIIVIIACMFIAMLARAVLLAQVFTVIYVYLSQNKIILTWSKIFIFIFFILFFVVILGTIRTSSDVGMLLEIGGMKDWPLWSLPFAWIYLYFTTSIENFRDFAFLYSDDFKYGVSSFLSPISNILQIKGEGIFKIQQIERSAGGFNTAGYYQSVFVDFGYLGYVYTTLLGYISRYLVNSNNIGIYLFSSFWSYAIFTSSINNYFNAFFTLVFLSYYLIVIKASKINVV
jgi:oligosaccharide repeat unit polymerase